MQAHNVHNTQCTHTTLPRLNDLKDIIWQPVNSLRAPSPTSQLCYGQPGSKMAARFSVCEQVSPISVNLSFLCVWICSNWQLCRVVLLHFKWNLDFTWTFNFGHRLFLNGFVVLLMLAVSVCWACLYSDRHNWQISCALCETQIGNLVYLAVMDYGGGCLTTHSLCMLDSVCHWAHSLQTVDLTIECIILWSEFLAEFLLAYLRSRDILGLVVPKVPIELGKITFWLSASAA